MQIFNCIKTTKKVIRKPINIYSVFSDCKIILRYGLQDNFEKINALN